MNALEDWMFARVGPWTQGNAEMVRARDPRYPVDVTHARNAAASVFRDGNMWRWVVWSIEPGSIGSRWTGKEASEADAKLAADRVLVEMWLADPSILPKDEQERVLASRHFINTTKEAL